MTTPGKSCSRGDWNLKPSTERSLNIAHVPYSHVILPSHIAAVIRIRWCANSLPRLDVGSGKSTFRWYKCTTLSPASAPASLLTAGPRSKNAYEALGTRQSKRPELHQRTPARLVRRAGRHGEGESCRPALVVCLRP